MEVESAMKAKEKASALKNLRLESYAIKGSEQDWQSALGDGNQKMGVSIKR